MGALYTRCRNGWKDAGGKMCVLFNRVTSYGYYASFGTRQFRVPVAPRPRRGATDRDAI